MFATILTIILVGQFPGQPDKQLPQSVQPQAAVPSKTTPLASPQVQAAPAPLASPQQTYADVPEQAPIVLRAIPRSYSYQRVIVQAAPAVQYQTVFQDVAPIQYSQVALADVGGCAIGQQAVIQRNVIGHQAVVSHGLQFAQVNHGLVGNGVGRQPKKIKTKQVTRVKRGLFGR